MSPPVVCVVILCWNGYADTARCIASVREQTYAPCRILVVDNGSADGSAARLRDHAEIELVALPHNAGYTGGNNVALEHAFAQGADYVWLLNSDAVAEPRTLATLVAVAETDRAIGLASPLLREQSGAREVGFACARVDLAVPSYQPTRDVTEAIAWHAAVPDRIVLHGTALLIRRALWERIGGLDDSFFAYWEDVDYSIRAAQAGFRNVTAFAAAVGHDSKPAKTAPESIRPHVYYYVARNEILLWRKHARGLPRLKALLWNLSAQLFQLSLMPAYKDGVEAILAGLWDGWCGRGGPRGARQMPQPLRGLLRSAPGLWVALLRRF